MLSRLRNKAFPGRGFLGTVKMLFRRMLRLGPRLSFAILVLDGFSVLCRVGAVLLLSVMAQAMQNAGLISIRGFSMQLPESIFSLGLIGGGAISILFLMSSAASFVSIRLARRLGRRLNEAALDDIMSGVMASPIDVMRVPPQDGAVFNRLLTQNAIHYGMMGETLIRLASPLMLFALAWLVVTMQVPLLGLGIILFVMLFAPIFFKMFRKTGRVASRFYADSATAMGVDVSKTVLQLTPQYGVYSAAQDPRELKRVPTMEKFLSNLDSNVLANERMGMMVGFVGALIMAMVIVINSYLAEHDAIDVPGMIALTGGFIYLIAAGRTVASMLTNLVRYHPQVKLIRQFAENLLAAKALPDPPLAPLPQTLSIPVPANGEVIKLSRGGARLGMIIPKELNKFSIPAFLMPLTGNSYVNAMALAPYLKLFSWRYRFNFGETVARQIAGGNDTLLSKAQDIAETLGVLSEYQALPQGLQTRMDNTIWNSLSGPARVALRMIALMVDETPRLIFIESQAVRNLNPKSFDLYFEHIKNSFVIITFPDKDCPKNLAEQFCIIKDNLILDFGDRPWLQLIDLPEAPLQSQQETTLFI